MSQIEENIWFFWSWDSTLVCICCAAITAQNYCLHPEKEHFPLSLYKIKKVNEQKVLDEWFQQFGTFHVKTIHFSVDVSFVILCGLYFIFLVENDRGTSLALPRPGLALPNTFIVDPSDMLCPELKAKWRSQAGVYLMVLQDNICP